MLLNTLIATELGKLDPISPGFAPADNCDAALTTFEQIISLALGGVTIVGGLYFVLNFVIAALNWLGSGGDSSKIQKARDSITHSLVGLIILIAAYSVLGIIGSILGLDLLNPAATIKSIIPGGC